MKNILMHISLAIILATVLAYASVTLTGCSADEEKLKTSADIPLPNIAMSEKVDVDYYGSVECYYVVDNNTGVMYMVFDGFRETTMTVMYNADGTIMTIEQLKSKENQEE